MELKTCSQPTSLTGGCQLLVRLGVPLSFWKKKKNSRSAVCTLREMNKQAISIKVLAKWYGSFSLQVQNLFGWMSITCLSMVKQTIIYNEGKWVNWFSSGGTSGTKYLTLIFWWQVLTILLGRMYFFSANCVFCSKTSPLLWNKKTETKTLVLEH
jgi:hypothetical protein